MTTPARPAVPPVSGAVARFKGVRAAHAVESVDLRAAPDRVAAGGWWAVVGDFDGTVRAWRFAEVERISADDGALSRPWQGPVPSAWRTSMDRGSYEAAVVATRAQIRDGDVYQANICRVLSALLPAPSPQSEPDAAALHALLARGNPAPYGGFIHVPRGGGLPGTWVVTASPELYLRRAGDRLTSAPIKGTARDEGGLLAKDRAENVMITDLVRNDLQQLCLPGSVEVPELLALEQHPGLVHLVSTVTGTLTPSVANASDGWARILEASYPPGSVSGAPKSAALRTIANLERADRGPYCGTVGWIDADAGTAELAVAIRTFWWDDDDGGTLRFGTGAGITWGSDPASEWEETELKARRLVAIASGQEDWES